MKYLISIIALSTLLSCVNNKNEEVHIKYVNLDSFTSMNVDCNSFEGYFESEIKSKKLIKNEAEDFKIQIFSFIKRAKPYDSGSPDVRIIINFSSNPNDTLCIGNNLVSYKGLTYENEDGFRIFLEKALK